MTQASLEFGTAATLDLIGSKVAAQSESLLRELGGVAPNWYSSSQGRSLLTLFVFGRPSEGKICSLLGILHCNLWRNLDARISHGVRNPT